MSPFVDQLTSALDAAKSSLSSATTSRAKRQDLSAIAALIAEVVTVCFKICVCVLCLITACGNLGCR